MQENDNRLEKFLGRLNTVETLAQLEKVVLAKTNGGTLKLGFLAYDNDNLNLFVSTNRKMNPSEEAKLSEEIMLTLGYDFTLPGCEIFIHYPSLFSKNEAELYDAIIDVTKENLVSGKLSAFLSRYYSEFFKLPQEEKKHSEHTELKATLVSLIKADPSAWEKLKKDRGAVLRELENDLEIEYKKDSPPSLTGQSTAVK